MDVLGNNPFGVLTLIVAPAILTNASSVSALATSNRLARATERARAISLEMEKQDNVDAARFELYLKLLQYAEDRLKLLVRALTAYYVSIGSFAAASLISVIGTGFFLIQWNVIGFMFMILSIIAGVSGVGGLVIGSFLLVQESRITFKSLSEETRFLVKHHEGKTVQTLKSV